MTAALRRLLAELQADRQGLQLQLQALERLFEASTPWNDDQTARAAVALHHGYGAIEAILQRVAREIEGDLPSGRDWHQALLRIMSLPIEGVRPAVLSPANAEALRRLLAFRHFFRHAYAATLDPARVRAIGQVALELRGPLSADLDALEALVRRLIDESIRQD